MKYLLDANVLSEPTKRSPDQRVVAWLRENESELVVSSVVLGEIWRGVDALPEGSKKQALAHWFEGLQASLTSLDWTVEVAIVWAELVNQVKRSGYTVGLMDTMIAAIAKRHALTVATRNVDDFARCSVAVINPFE